MEQLRIFLHNQRLHRDCLVHDICLRPSDRRDVVRRWFGATLDDALVSRSVGALSEGERQRILLAAEVIRLDEARGRTRLLLLDEPFGAVDPAAHLRLMNALLGWVNEPSRRNAAILVSHSPLMDLGLARAFGVTAREWCA